MQQSIDQRWSEQYSNGRDYTLISRQSTDKILAYTSKDAPKTCLDLGCGTGQLTRELYHRGYQCVGIDVSSTAIEFAKAATIAPSEALAYCRGDIEIEDLTQLPHAKYGLVMCKLVYAFVKNKTAFLQRVKTALAPSGIFVVITPLSQDVSDEQQAIAASTQEMKLLTDNFIEVATYKDFGLTYFIGRKG